MEKDWKSQLNEMGPSVLAAKLAEYINARFGDKASTFEVALELNMLGMERVEVE
jgi:hypothetical protein